jgi:hypothetical protein
MAQVNPKLPGDELAEQWTKAIQVFDSVPLPGARKLPVLSGLDRRGDFVVTQENILISTADILVTSQKVYTYGDSIVLEIENANDTGPGLVLLRTGTSVESSAKGFLANLMVCQAGEKQFPPPHWFVDVLLRAETVIKRLPRIRWYAQRPVFDEAFILRGPGWHADIGLLIHGPEIEPTFDPVTDATGGALERLPHHLQTLLGGFCFHADADVVNTVALLLTGLLVHRFIVSSKPIGLVDGNQPGLGKTLLVRVIGILLDNVAPHLIPFTSDEEELHKRLCATLRDGRQSIVLLDNAKMPAGQAVTSPVLESTSMTPEIALRILGTSQNLIRPNDVLWFLTMNDTKTSPDLVSRGLPVQLAYEGSPEERSFDGPDPIRYAREHRRAILGELAGLVIHWNQQGQPLSQHTHRIHDWARTLGGILEAAGLPEFLANAGAAAASFSTVLDELTALFEAAYATLDPNDENDSGEED